MNEMKVVHDRPSEMKAISKMLREGSAKVVSNPNPIKQPHEWTMRPISRLCRVYVMQCLVEPLDKLMDAAMVLGSEPGREKEAYAQFMSLRTQIGRNHQETQAHLYMLGAYPQ